MARVTRGEKAGRKYGKAIVEVVNLMYQNNTARHFYTGLAKELIKEWRRRGLIVERRDLIKGGD